MLSKLFCSNRAFCGTFRQIIVGADRALSLSEIITEEKKEDSDKTDP